MESITRAKTGAKVPLGLVHSDVCGKISTPSKSGGLYFVTFIDDATRYVPSVSEVHGVEGPSGKLKWTKAEDTTNR